MKLQKVRAIPRISVNKLGEYLVASASKRRRILSEQKRPKAFQVHWYAQAETVIKKYLLDENRSNQILLDGIQELSNKNLVTNHEKDVNQSCIEAISAFATMAHLVDTANLSLTAGPPSQVPIKIGGVDVSIRPEIIVAGLNRSGTKFSGAIKLHISKGNALDIDSGEYVSTLIHHFIDKTPLSIVKPDRTRCVVIDVFRGKVYPAPKTRTRRMQDIEAACDEIASRWASI